MKKKIIPIILSLLIIAGIATAAVMVINNNDDKKEIKEENNKKEESKDVEPSEEALDEINEWKENNYYSNVTIINEDSDYRKDSGIVLDSKEKVKEITDRMTNFYNYKLGYNYNESHYSYLITLLSHGELTNEHFYLQPHCISKSYLEEKAKKYDVNLGNIFSNESEQNLTNYYCGAGSSAFGGIRPTFLEMVENENSLSLIYYKSDGEKEITITFTFTLSGGIYKLEDITLKEMDESTKAKYEHFDGLMLLSSKKLQNTSFEYKNYYMIENSSETVDFGFNFEINDGKVKITDSISGEEYTIKKINNAKYVESVNFGQVNTNGVFVIFTESGDVYISRYTKDIDIPSQMYYDFITDVKEFEESFKLLNGELKFTSMYFNMYNYIEYGLPTPVLVGETSDGTLYRYDVKEKKFSN